MRREPFLDPAVVQEDMRIRSVPEQVYRVILRAILSGRFEPGEWLRQRDVAGELGVGISTVREALNRLAAEGYLVAETNKGFRTAIPTMEHMIDQGEALMLLEPRALELAADHISAQELGQMRELLPYTVPGSGEAANVMKADHDFHSIAFGASRRPYLTQLLEQTWAQYHMMAGGLLNQMSSEVELHEWSESIQTAHTSILEGLEAGDGKQASEACSCLWEEHIRLVQSVFDRIRHPSSPSTATSAGSPERRQAGRRTVISDAPDASVPIDVRKNN